LLKNPHCFFIASRLSNPCEKSKICVVGVSLSGASRILGVGGPGGGFYDTLMTRRSSSIPATWHGSAQVMSKAFSLIEMFEFTKV